MLPTFVIGSARRPRGGAHRRHHRGVPAQAGRRDLLRWVLVGVGIAVVLCFAAGLALDVLQKDLPQRQQEGLETVIGAIAVGDGHVHGHLDEAPLARTQGPARGHGPGRDGRRVRGRPRHGRDGVPRGAARGPRDRRVPARRVQPVDQRRQRPGGRRARRRRRDRARLRHLPRRRAHQPVAVLPRHGPGARARRGRAGRERAAHRARGGLARRRAGQHRRPHLAGRPRLRPGVAAHRHARAAGRAGRHRGHRLAALPRPGRRVRRVAAGQGPRAPDDRRASCSRAVPRSPSRQRPSRSPRPAAPAANPLTRSGDTYLSASVSGDARADHRGASAPDGGEHGRRVRR